MPDLMSVEGDRGTHSETFKCLHWKTSWKSSLGKECGKPSEKLLAALTSVWTRPETPEHLSAETKSFFKPAGVFMLLGSNKAPKESDSDRQEESCWQQCGLVIVWPWMKGSQSCACCIASICDTVHDKRVNDADGWYILHLTVKALALMRGGGGIWFQSTRSVMNY